MTRSELLLLQLKMRTPKTYVLETDFRTYCRIKNTNTVTLLILLSFLFNLFLSQSTKMTVKETRHISTNT